MRLFLFLLLWMVCGLVQAQSLLNRVLDFQVAGMSRVEALNQLSEESGVNIAFASSLFAEDTLLNLSYRRASLRTILDDILAGAEVEYTELGRQIMLQRKPRVLRYFTYNGYVEDAHSGERLIGANVYDPVSGSGTATNVYGFFSLTLPAGIYVLNVSYLGYQSKKDTVKLGQDVYQEIRLQTSLTLEEILVVGSDSVIQASTTEALGSNSVQLDQLSNLPMLGGEVDLMRLMDMLPGVQSGPDGIGGLHIRGGNADQNLVLLDGVPIYNGSHLLGFYSMFNDFAIQKADLHKSTFESRHGGRLSSVIDIRMREGDKQQFHGGISAGLLTSKVFLEGPLKKGKTSFLLSGRRIFWDWLFGAISGSLLDTDEENDLKYYFYDWNAKVNHTISEKDRVFLSIFRGGDVFYFKERDTIFSENRDPLVYRNHLDVRWTNTVGALRWNHLFTPKLFLNTTLTYSKFNFLYRNYSHEYFTDSLQTNSLLMDYNRSVIRDYGLRFDFDYFYSPRHLVTFGSNLIYHQFYAASGDIYERSRFSGGFEIESDVEKLSAQFPVDKVDALELSAYLEDEWTPSPAWQFRLGLYATIFGVEGKSYYSLQPRFSATWKIVNNFSWQTSASHMAQFLHLVTGSNIGLPSDLWVPATARIRPQEAWQASSGFLWEIPNGINLSLEGYYKKMEHLLNFVNVTNNPLPLGLEGWEDRVGSGNGEAYGLEFLAERNFARTKGWVSYSLAWAERQFADVNNGERFPFKYDRRHFIKTAMLHKFSKRFEMGLNWIYGTGNPMTLESGQFSTPFGTSFILFSSKNSVRIPAYHRLDLSFNFIKQKKWGTRVWNISIYNLYNRINPFWIYKDNVNEEEKTYKLSIFPLFPSFNYRYQF